MKGVSVLIASVLVIAISLAGITIVMTYGMPVLDKNKEALLIAESERNLETIDNAIKNVALEGVNSSRVLDISVTSGTYTVKNYILSFSCDCKYLKPKNLTYEYGFSINDIEFGKSAQKLTIKNLGYNDTIGMQIITIVYS